MNSWKIFFIGIFFSGAACAQSHWYVDANVAGALTQVGQSQYVELIKSLQLGNRYVVDKHSVIMPIATLGVGYTFDLAEKPAVQMGIGAQVLQPLQTWKTKGVVWQGGLPDYANLGFSYKTQSTAMLANFQLLTKLAENLQPYITAGIGVARNHSYGYKEWPLASHAVPMDSPFAAKTNIAVAYQVGAGFVYTIHPKVQLLLAYHFLSLGRSILGLSKNQTTTGHLKTNNICINMIGLGLRYLIA